MSNWSESDNWLEIYKRKLCISHKDLYVYLDHIIENSNLEFIDVNACALAAARALGYPVLVAAIEKEMEHSVEKTAAAIAASMSFLNTSWINYLEVIKEDQKFLPQTHDVQTPYGGVSELKFNMYCLSACVAYGCKSEIERHVRFLSKHLSKEQINDIVRISSVISATIKAQV